MTWVRTLKQKYSVNHASIRYFNYKRKVYNCNYKVIVEMLPSCPWPDQLRVTSAPEPSLNSISQKTLWPANTTVMDYNTQPHSSLSRSSSPDFQSHTPALSHTRPCNTHTLRRRFSGCEGFIHRGFKQNLQNHTRDRTQETKQKQNTGD